MWWRRSHDQIAMIERGNQAPVVRWAIFGAHRDFSDVRDIVRAYELAATHCSAGEVYNIGSGEAVEIRAILDTLIGLSTAAISVEIDPARFRPIDVPVIACDATALSFAHGLGTTDSPPTITCRRARTNGGKHHKGKHEAVCGPWSLVDTRAGEIR